MDILVAGRPFTIFFDGATRYGELAGIIVRIIDDDLMPHRLSLTTEPASVNGDRLAQLLAYEMTTRLALTPEDICRHLARQCRCELRKKPAPHVHDMPCYPHLINIISEHIDVAYALELISKVAALMSLSHGARHAWKEMFGSAFQ